MSESEKKLLGKIRISERINKVLDDLIPYLIEGISIANEIDYYAKDQKLDNLVQDSNEAKIACEQALEFVDRLKDRYKRVNHTEEAP